MNLEFVTALSALEANVPRRQHRWDYVSRRATYHLPPESVFELTVREKDQRRFVTAEVICKVLL